MTDVQSGPLIPPAGRLWSGYPPLSASLTSPPQGRGIAYERRSPPSSFSPAGRRCRQADEGVPAKTTKIHEFKSITPSSDPSGHLLPKGRRSLWCSSASICDSPAPQGGRLVNRGYLWQATDIESADTTAIRFPRCCETLQAISPLVGEMSRSDRGGCVASTTSEANVPGSFFQAKGQPALVSGRVR